MEEIKTGDIIKVTNTRCVGIKIEDHSYDAKVCKVNQKSFAIDNGHKFTLRKVTDDGREVWKSPFNEVIII